MNRQLHRSTWVSLLFTAAIVFFSAAFARSGTKLIPISSDTLCVTEGTIEAAPTGRLTVSVSKMRAYVNFLTPQIVEAKFTYLGGTKNEARLGSGELRRQFGLKLRAQDACNLVYAMWRIDPESKLVVSIKSNSGQHASAECGNRGYRNIKPRHSVPVPVLRLGDSHTLRAEMREDELRVFVDNGLVWEGPLGPDALAFDGPVGIRSDNAHLELELRAAEALPSPRSYPGACRSNESE